MSGSTLKQIRVGLLFSGVIISWAASINAFITFFTIGGVNPLITPCFWGAVAFAAAFAWSIFLVEKENKRQNLYLTLLLLGATLFAWTNFVIELKGITYIPRSPLQPCPATKASPFLSPCFFGSIFFTISLITSVLVVFRKKS